jgi:hypothetical protein
VTISGRNVRIRCLTGSDGVVAIAANPDWAETRLDEATDGWIGGIVDQLCRHNPWT